MAKFGKNLFNIAALALFAAIAMGVEACDEPKEYCSKAYSNEKDQAACTRFCDENKDFTNPDAAKRKGLIQACQRGQLIFLSNQRRASESMLVCDREFSATDLAKACRSGVTGEELRTSKSRKSPGTSSDRETGNNR
jgi:hypothetical protein